MKACRLFLAFFLLQLLSFEPVSSSVLTEVCNYIGDSYATFPCLRIIGADPRSETVKDIRDVAILAADITTDNAVQLQSYAQELLDNATDADAKSRAEGAVGIFTDAIKNLKFVKDSLVANSLSGVTSVAESLKDVESSALKLIDLKKFNHVYTDISFVLWALVAHMDK